MKLKPCPFCGSDRVYPSSGPCKMPFCRECHATGPFRIGDTNLNALWNKRAAKRKVKK